MDFQQRTWPEVDGGLLSWGPPGPLASGLWVNWGHGVPRTVLSCLLQSAHQSGQLVRTTYWSSQEPLLLQPHNHDLMAADPLRARILKTAIFLHPILQDLGLGNPSVWPLRMLPAWELGVPAWEEWQPLKYCGDLLESAGPRKACRDSWPTLRPWSCEDQWPEVTILSQLDETSSFLDIRGERS